MKDCPSLQRGYRRDSCFGPFLPVGPCFHKTHPFLPLSGILSCATEMVNAHFLFQTKIHSRWWCKGPQKTLQGPNTNSIWLHSTIAEGRLSGEMFGFCSIELILGNPGRAMNFTRDCWDSLPLWVVSYFRGSCRTWRYYLTWQKQMDRTSIANNMKLDLHLTPSTKINWKWIIDLNVKYKTIKLLEENVGEKLCDLKLGEEVLDTAPKAPWKRKD